MVCHQEPSLPELRHSFSKLLGILELFAHSATQSCLTLCGPWLIAPPGSPAHGIFQASILVWHAFSTPGIFPTQGLNPSLLHLLHWQVNSLPLSYLRSQMGIPDHLTCLLRNLYAGKEATVRTGHGTTDCLQL